MNAIAIRPEQPSDAEPIRVLTEAAFRDMPFADGDEHELVGRLRNDADLTLSLVAEDASGIVGHIAFSPVAISDGAAEWYGLGPVSVRPDLQRQGIGDKLIQRGIADMRQCGAHGIVLVGSDEYYPRFGFENDPRLTYPGAPAQYFQRLVLDGDPPSGTVSFAPAFS